MAVAAGSEPCVCRLWHHSSLVHTSMIQCNIDTNTKTYSCLLVRVWCAALHQSAGFTQNKAVQMYRCPKGLRQSDVMRWRGPEAVQLVVCDVSYHHRPSSMSRYTAAGRPLLMLSSWSCSTAEQYMAQSAVHAVHDMSEQYKATEMLTEACKQCRGPAAHEHVQTCVAHM